MKKFEYTIKDSIGIHARPAGLLVKEAQKFDSNIYIKNTQNSKNGDAKKIFALMGLGAKCGTVVEVICDGEDEENAITCLKKFFENNL